MQTKRLYRSVNDRMIAGVCGGIAEYFQIDPTIVRIIAVVLSLGSFFSLSLLPYIVCAIVIPNGPAPNTYQTPNQPYPPYTGNPGPYQQPPVSGQPYATNPPPAPPQYDTTAQNTIYQPPATPAPPVENTTDIGSEQNNETDPPVL